MNLSIKNWVMTGLIAVTFIILLKVVVNKYSILEPVQSTVNMI